MDKEEIISELRGIQEQMDTLVLHLSNLDGDTSLDRWSTVRITYTLFEMMDKLSSTEINIYNFLKRRQNGLLIQEDSKAGT